MDRTHIHIPRSVNKLPSDEVQPQKCGNCGTWRQVSDYVVEKCPLCGDDEYNLADKDDLP
jgi:Zn finger protein HypA/HybF involved in hydrogenase expression